MEYFFHTDKGIKEPVANFACLSLKKLFMIKSKKIKKYVVSDQTIA